MALDPEILNIQKWSDSGSNRRDIPPTAAADVLSRDKGWPPAYSQPVASGGKLPNHMDMNQAFREITGYVLDMLLGESMAWDNDIDYSSGAIVYHSGNIWRSLIDSNGGEPTTGSTNWEVIDRLESEDISSLSIVGRNSHEWNPSYTSCIVISASGQGGQGGGGGGGGGGAGTNSITTPSNVISAGGGNGGTSGDPDTRHGIDGEPGGVSIYGGGGGGGQGSRGHFGANSYVTIDGPVRVERTVSGSVVSEEKEAGENLVDSGIGIGGSPGDGGSGGGIFWQNNSIIAVGGFGGGNPTVGISTARGQGGLDGGSDTQNGSNALVQIDPGGVAGGAGGGNGGAGGRGGSAPAGGTRRGGQGGGGGGGGEFGSISIDVATIRGISSDVIEINVGGGGPGGAAGVGGFGGSGHNPSNNGIQGFNGSAGADGVQGFVVLIPQP